MYQNRYQSRLEISSSLMGNNTVLIIQGGKT